MEDDKLLMEMIDVWTLHISTAPENIEQFFTRSFRSTALEAIEDSLYLRGMQDRKVHPLAQRIWDCLFGQALLNTLLQDPRVSDIKFLAHNQIRLKCMGTRRPSKFFFQSREQYLHFVEYILLKNGLHLSGIQPMLSFYDTTSRPEDILCFHISSHRITSANVPLLHLRRIPKKKRSLANLVSDGTLSAQAADILTEHARCGGCILFTGKDMGTQRILINAMLDIIPHDRSALAIQETEELFSLSHPEIMFQHTAPSSRSQLSCDTRELMEYGLLLDSDYFILDELTQENALPFWKAAAKGCRCWTSLPAKNAAGALFKLADFLCQETLTPRDTVLASFCRFSCIICVEGKKVTGLSTMLGWDTENQELQFRNLLEPHD